MKSNDTQGGLGRRGFLGLAGTTVTAAALNTSLAQRASAAEPAVPAGLRRARPSGETIRYPSDVMAASPDAPGVLNVKTLFGAVGDGKADDTDALIAAIDAVEGPVRDGDKSVAVGQKIIYLPNGTYRVSRTLIYSFPYFTPPHYPSSEGLRYLRFRGESQGGVVIRLADAAPGFGGSTPTPVLSFAKGTGANFVVASNAVENLTIDVGARNPGAVGLLFAGANNAAIRNVTIRSSDPDGAGAIGLRVSTGSTQLALHNVDIHGFDHSVTAEAHQSAQLTLDRLELSGYRVNGVAVTGSSVSLHHLSTHGSSGPAVSLEDIRAQVSVADSVMRGSGPAADAAIVVTEGSLFAKNLRAPHYPVSIRPSAGSDITGNVESFSSPPVRTLFADASESDVDIPDERFPDFPWIFGNAAAVSVNAFGAVGDGVADDTSAIRAAFNSGSPSVYFRPGNYLITDTIDLPVSLRQVNFMYSRVAVGTPLQKPMGTPVDAESAVFRVVGDQHAAPLLIEDMLCFPQAAVYRIFEHVSQRTLVLSDMHWQRGGVYRSSTEGARAFFDNVSNRSGNHDDGNPAFVLGTGTKAWARHINPEHASTAEIVSQGAQFRILGFKKEGHGSLLQTSDGACTNVLGGVVYRVGGFDPGNRPLVDCDDSTLGLSCATSMLKNDSTNGRYWHVAVKQTQDGATGTLYTSDLARRGPDWGDGSERHLARFIAAEPGTDGGHRRGHR